MDLKKHGTVVIEGLDHEIVYAGPNPADDCYEVIFDETKAQQMLSAGVIGEREFARMKAYYAAFIDNEDAR